MNEKSGIDLFPWRRWKIANKLTAGFSLILLLVIVIVAASLLGLRDVQSTFQAAINQGSDVERLASEIRIELLEARRFEKEFLLRWRVEGFDDAYNHYVGPNQVYIDHLRGSITELETLAAESSPSTMHAVGTELDDLQTQIDIYEREFQRTVELIERRGFKDTGLEGQFRDAVHQIEDSLEGTEGTEALQVLMLEIRRREKDYLLRGEQQYVENVRDLIRQLKEQISTSQLPVDEQERNRQLADNYLATLESLVSVEQEIASSIETYRDAADRTEPLIAAITAAGSQTASEAIMAAETTIARTVRRVSVGLVIVLIGGLGLSRLLARQMTLPIQNLSETARQLAEGDFRARAQVHQLDEIGQTARTFNQMADELAETLSSLEERVAARTQHLEIITHLSGHLSAILNLDRLLAEVVNQVKDSFNYYHVHIYLLDDVTEKLMMAEGTGAAGAEMKANGHSIPFDASTSLVARAARTGEVVAVDNVREADDWLPNPLLPDTYSEMAVPIMLEEKVVGILDVQQAEVAGLDDGDAGLLRSVANHVAVALRNARLFEEVTAALADARAAQQRYVEQVWDRTKIAQHGTTCGRFSLVESSLSEDAILRARQQALKQKEPTVVIINSGDSIIDKNRMTAPDQQRQGEIGETPSSARSDRAQYALVAPIMLHETPIGDLQLHHIDPDRQWTESELELIETVIDQVAQTAEGLRLFNETQELARRERLVNQINDKMRRAPDMEKLVQIAVDELSKALGPARTFIHLDPRSHSELAGGQVATNDEVPRGRGTTKVGSDKAASTDGSSTQPTVGSQSNGNEDGWS